MMQITTYYVTATAADADAKALVHLINDTGFANGDNRNWNATRARLDAAFNADTQHRLGIDIEAVECEEATDD